MKQYIMIVMAMLLAVSMNYGQTGAGAFGADCATIEQQQAQYNQSKANQIVVTNTYTQQLACHYQQLATYYQQLHKTNQQIAKDKQQVDKDIQQIAKDKQQVEKDAAQRACDSSLNTKKLELDAREALLKAKEEDCNLMYVFCHELKLIIENPDCDDKKLADHVKNNINHSGQADGTNPGNTTNNNGGILNPHN